MAMNPDPGPAPHTRKGPRGLLLGATGLIGRELLEAYLADPKLGEIITITRRPIERAEHPAWTQIILPNFDDLGHALIPDAFDFAVSCLGSTIKQAGSKDNFRKVDLGYNSLFARMVRERKIPRFVLLSAKGANPNSMFFYNKIKGELEDAVKALGFPALVIIQPGLLLGDRTEQRPAENLIIQATRQLTKRIGPKVQKLYANEAKDVVDVLKRESLSAQPRCVIISGDEIERMSARIVNPSSG